MAFEDTWHWRGAAATYDDLILEGDKVSEMLQAFRSFIGENQMMAYLVMMAVRLKELHRVLKPTGSLYLHCDPTASHYLKILLDTIFSPQNYRNEITWIRTSAHANVQQKYGAVHDIIYFYSKTNKFTWNQQYLAYDDEYLKTFFDQTDSDGRRYQRRDLTASMQRASSGQLYTWRGITPPPSRCWATKNVKRKSKNGTVGKLQGPKVVKMVLQFCIFHFSFCIVFPQPQSAWQDFLVENARTFREKITPPNARAAITMIRTVVDCASIPMIISGSSSSY